MGQHSGRYWLDRFNADRDKLDEKRKQELVKTVLTYLVPLTPEEAELFITSKRKTAEELLAYSVIERKVANAYSCASQPSENKALSESFRKVLEGFYTPQELDEIAPWFVLDQDVDIVMFRLAGYEHPSARRIRNAYLPEIMDLVVIDKKGGHDMTYRLFDGPGDAVSQADKLMGKPSK